MKTIIFDIETIPIDFDSLDEAEKKYLLKNAETREEKKIVKDQMALWAPTNRIVAIGVLSGEDDRGAVYFQSEDKNIESFEEEGIKYVAGAEKEILEHFWKVISFANKFVTFNGRGFDCPTLMLRSAMLGVKPTKNLVPYRYSADIHIDLLEQLTFYGTARKFNLDFFCKAFGIESPKANGITGLDVFPMFKAKEYENIARYCAGDLWATRELYRRWENFLHF